MTIHIQLFVVTSNLLARFFISVCLFTLLSCNLLMLQLFTRTRAKAKEA